MLYRMAIKMKISEAPLTKGRIYYLDVLRCLACTVVVLAHSSSTFVIQYFGSFNYWAGNIITSLCRLAVPVFLMISGSLLLDENYEFTKKKWLNHIKKMVIYLVFWSAACAVFNKIALPVLTHGEISVFEIAKEFILGPTYLWFMYMIIGLYMILPLLRLWVKKENKKQIKYFIILGIISAYIIPQIARVGSLYSDYFGLINSFINKLNLKYAGGYTAPFILGWYIHNFPLKKTYKKLIYALGIVSPVVAVAVTAIVEKTTGIAEIMYDSMTTNVLFYSIMVFVLIKSATEKTKPEKQSKLIMGISKHSLGIYAVHPFPIFIISNILVKLGIENAIISVPIIFVISMAASFAASLVLRKLPLLKNVV